MFQASTSSYKILSQEPQVDENENDFSSSLSSDESEDSLDLALNKIRNSQRKPKRKRKRIKMVRIDGFDAAAESYEVSRRFLINFFDNKFIVSIV